MSKTYPFEILHLWIRASRWWRGHQRPLLLFHQGFSGVESIVSDEPSWCYRSRWQGSIRQECRSFSVYIAVLLLLLYNFCLWNTTEVTKLVRIPTTHWCTSNNNEIMHNKQKRRTTCIVPMWNFSRDFLSNNDMEYMARSMWKPAVSGKQKWKEAIRTGLAPKTLEKSCTSDQVGEPGVAPCRIHVNCIIPFRWLSKSAAVVYKK